jgi:hypothetical protein
VVGRADVSKWIFVDDVAGDGPRDERLGEELWVRNAGRSDMMTR